MAKLIDVMRDLENEFPLAPQLKEHPLQGQYGGSLECHIAAGLAVDLPNRRWRSCRQKSVLHPIGNT
jgi:hypothetical protein